MNVSLQFDYFYIMLNTFLNLGSYEMPGAHAQKSIEYFKSGLVPANMWPQ